MTVLIWILIAAAADSSPPANPISAKPETTVEETGLVAIVDHPPRLRRPPHRGRNRRADAGHAGQQPGEHQAVHRHRKPGEGRLFPARRRRRPGLHRHLQVQRGHQRPLEYSVSAARNGQAASMEEEILPATLADSASERPNRATSKSANTRPSPPSAWLIRMATSSGPPPRRAAAASFTAPARM